jgi:hypothetical protein
MAPPTAAALAAPKIHTPEEWSRQRLRITELYRIQDLTLREIMEIMRTEHDFDAT